MNTDILVTIAIVFVTQFVVMYVNIKRQFAKSEAEAMHAGKRVLFIVTAIIQWLAIAYLVWRGILQLVADAPVTARDVVWMLVASFVIFHSYLMIWFWLFGRYIEGLRGALKKTVDATVHLLEAHDKMG